MKEQLYVISLLATKVSITVHAQAIIYFRNRLTGDLQFSEVFQQKTST